MAPAPWSATQQPACAARPEGSSRMAPAGCGRVHSAPCQPSGTARLRAHNAPSGGHAWLRFEVRVEVGSGGIRMGQTPEYAGMLKVPVAPWLSPRCPELSLRTRR